MSKLSELIEKINLEMTTNPSIEKNLNYELSKIIATCNISAMNSDESYCFKFNIPSVQVGKLPNLLNVTVKEIYDAFESDWTSIAMTNRMYADSYYQTMLLIVLYGITYNKPNISEMALLITMFKLWNGRKTKYLPWCDKAVMKYVINSMCTRRHHITKYDDPFSLLKNYFVPTILAKYSNAAKTDQTRKKLQTLFSQSWSRLDQLFVSRKVEDIESGKRFAQGGILPLYKKAKEEGLSIADISKKGIEDDELQFGDQISSSTREDIISDVAEYITMHPNQKYAQNFISQLNTETHVSSKVLEQLLKGIHNYQFYDLIHDILSIILSSTNVNTKEDICKQKFNDDFKRKVISSKNNEDAKKIQLLCNKLLKDIFNRSFKSNLDNYSGVHQIQLKKVLLNGIFYNLKKYICKQV